MASAKARLDRYFDMINKRVPAKVSRSIRWLRKPSSFPIRFLVAVALIVGGLFSFLPVLGLWMLPLGLLFVAQDLPFLQQPLANVLGWIEAKWDWLRAWIQRRGQSDTDRPKHGARPANWKEPVEECQGKRGDTQAHVKVSGPTDPPSVRSKPAPHQPRNSYPLPEGLRRPRRGPLNKDTGRRPK
jgi:hypothetical protein